VLGDGLSWALQTLQISAAGFRWLGRVALGPDPLTTACDECRTARPCAAAPSAIPDPGCACDRRSSMVSGSCHRLNWFAWLANKLKLRPWALFLEAPRLQARRRTPCFIQRQLAGGQRRGTWWWARHHHPMPTSKRRLLSQRDGSGGAVRCAWSPTPAERARARGWCGHAGPIRAIPSAQCGWSGCGPVKAGPLLVCSRPATEHGRHAPSRMATMAALDQLRLWFAARPWGESGAGHPPPPASASEIPGPPPRLTGPPSPPAVDEV